MIKVLVISDDMTGNNDTGALLNQAGLDTVAALRDELPEEYLGGRDALCLNTDSRALSAREAKELVRKAAGRYWKPGMLCCKRIDSTLRGNVGAEIDGMLEMLPAGYKAVLVPAFPRAGRICIGGYVMVNGELLTSSGAQNDLKTPVHSSKVTQILAEQSSRRTEVVELPQVREETAALARRIKESEAEILIMDAICDADIDLIARACLCADVPVACADPGSFTVSMAQKKFAAQAAKIPSRNLLVVGSVSEVTRRQIAYLTKREEVLICRISVKRLLEEYEQLKEEVVEYVCKHAEAYENICLLTDDQEREEGAAAAREISGRFAGIGACVWENLQEETGCVYLCGGDTASDFLEEIQVCAIDIEREVLPLAVCGRAIRANQTASEKGFQILTKGGMIGSESTVYEMLAYAKRARREEGD
ncbi:MAG: four-carbon acid sugar kinase family protein [Lachnospiraceae bacterium]|nr:four-carbon acid sugar kinase family protein [Lachnospiraceae bacterium]